jgi:DNA-binding beta-propeller fold protein YncE
MGSRVASTGPRRAARRPLALALVALLAPALGWAQTCTWGGTPSVPMPTVTALRSDSSLLAAPARLAVDGDGRRYVTDPSGGRLLVRDANGRFVRALDGLGRPLGVAVDAFGVAYVGDELTGSVSLLDPEGHFLRKLGGGDGEFVLPGHLAVDPRTGIVYVADSGADEVKAYRDGQLVARFGGPGSAAGQFSFPTGIHVSSEGEVFVADQNNDRVQVFDRDGGFLRCFGKTGGMSLKPRFGRVQGLTGDSAGRIYAADAFQGSVKVFDSAGVALGTIGQFGDRVGELRLPQSLAVDAVGRLHVAATGNSRVEVFGLDGYSDPHVLEGNAEFLLPASGPTRVSRRRALLKAAIDVSGRAEEEIVASSLAANGVISRGAAFGRDGRFQAAFDLASVAATLPPGGGWVAIRGELTDGSEFEAAAWLGTALPATRAAPPARGGAPAGPTRGPGTRPVTAGRGGRP